jgi:hypothetical protein
MREAGILIVRDDGVIDVPDAAAIPASMPAALAAAVEHTVVAMFGGWPTDDNEIWWPTAAAMQEA